MAVIERRRRRLLLLLLLLVPPHVIQSILTPPHARVRRTDGRTDTRRTRANTPHRHASISSRRASSRNTSREPHAPKFRR